MNRTYFTVCGAVIGWSLGVVAPAYGRWPRLFYDPAVKRWFFATSAGALPIAYYGLLLWGLVGLGLGALGGRSVASERPESYWLGAAWAVTAAVLAMSYYTFMLWPQPAQ